MQKIYESDLRKALLDMRAKEVEDLERRVAQQPPHRFSLRFRLKMWYLFWVGWEGKDASPAVRRRISLRKTIVVFFAVLLAALTLGLTVGAIHGLYRLVEVIFSDHSVVYYKGRAAEHDEFVLYEIAELPEGFVLDEEDSYFLASTGRASTYYRNGDVYVLLDQYCVDKMEMFINTEEVILIPTIVGEKEGHYYTNDGVKNFFWVDGEYSFLISGTVDKDILLNLVNHVRIKSTDGQVVSGK